jgi:hypothetical protein
VEMARQLSLHPQQQPPPPQRQWGRMLSACLTRCRWCQRQRQRGRQQRLVEDGWPTSTWHRRHRLRYHHRLRSQLLPRQRLQQQRQQQRPGRVLLLLHSSDPPPPPSPMSAVLSRDADFAMDRGLGHILGVWHDTCARIPGSVRSCATTRVVGTGRASVRPLRATPSSTNDSSSSSSVSSVAAAAAAAMAARRWQTTNRSNAPLLRVVSAAAAGGPIALLLLLLLLLLLVVARCAAGYTVRELTCYVVLCCAALRW